MVRFRRSSRSSEESSSSSDDGGRRRGHRHGRHGRRAARRSRSRSRSRTRRRRRQRSLSSSSSSSSGASSASSSGSSDRGRRGRGRGRAHRRRPSELERFASGASLSSASSGEDEGRGRRGGRTQLRRRSQLEAYVERGRQLFYTASGGEDDFRGALADAGLPPRQPAGFGRARSESAPGGGAAVGPRHAPLGRARSEMASYPIARAPSGEVPESVPLAAPVPVPVPGAGAGLQVATAADVGAQLFAYGVQTPTRNDGGVPTWYCRSCGHWNLHDVRTCVVCREPVAANSPTRVE